MTFKLAATVLALASFTAATGSAMAATDTFLVGVGDPSTFNSFGISVGAAPSQGSWAISELLMGALAITSTQTTAVAPGHVVQDEGSPFLPARFDTPLRRIGGVVDGQASTVSIRRAEFGGGIRFDVSGLRPSGGRNVASTGGSLTLSDIAIDFETKAIYATLEGGNGVGLQQNQRLWDFSALQGTTTVTCQGSLGGGDACSSLNAAGLTVSGLSITASAFDLVSTSLGLTPFGKTALSAVSQYGVVTISAVPEMSSSWLALAGLAALGVAARRNRRAPN